MKCPKCSKEMERREHYTITPKMLKRKYWFSEWDYCKSCQFIKNYGKYIVRDINKLKLPQIRMF